VCACVSLFSLVRIHAPSEAGRGGLGGELPGCGGAGVRHRVRAGQRHGHRSEPGRGLPGGSRQAGAPLARIFPLPRTSRTHLPFIRAVWCARARRGSSLSSRAS
jgi:hypothetical protein